MSEPAYNSVAWFEIGADDPDAIERFYGELFGCVMSTGGRFPNYAAFYVVVEDVAATVAKAERLGAKALLPPTTAPDGLVFAQLHDPSGNQIGLFTPAPTAT